MRDLALADPQDLSHSVEMTALPVMSASSLGCLAETMRRIKRRLIFNQKKPRMREHTGVFNLESWR